MLTYWRRPRVKKALIFLAVFATLSLTSLSAQESENEKESQLYPKHIYVAKIWSHKLGFRIDYYRDDKTIGTLYAPLKWFREAGGLAQLGFDEGDQVPYMTVFYKEGKVSHFRVFAYRDITHYTWGTPPSAENWDDRFNTEEPLFEYFAPKKSDAQ
jgi:hypothetical protein